MKPFVLLPAAALLAAAMSPAHALFGDDEARKAIIELRAQVQNQQQVQMQMFDKIEKLTQQVQSLRGQLDELNNTYGQQKQKTEAMYSDVSSRLTALDPKAKADQAAADAEIAAKQATDEGVRLFNQTDFAKAERQLANTVKNYPKTKSHAEALYWLGNTYYARGNFAKAIEAEQRFIRLYPRHARAPEAMLVLGTAQMEAKRTDQAKATFEALIRQYPKSSAAQIAKKQI